PAVRFLYAPRLSLWNCCFRPCHLCTGVPDILIGRSWVILDDSSARDACWLTACEDEVQGRPRVDVAALALQIGQTREVFWADAEHRRRWRLDMRAAWGQIATEASPLSTWTTPASARVSGRGTSRFARQPERRSLVRSRRCTSSGAAASRSGS